MSSRTDYRRRERSWEREDRDRHRERDRDRDRYSRSGRPSHHRESTRRRDSKSPSPRRSRSPRRDREYDRERGKDREYKSKRDRDRDDRKSDTRDERWSSKRDDRHGHQVTDRGFTKDAKASTHRARRPDEHDVERTSEQTQSPQASTSKQDLDLNVAPEEGEEMDATNADDEAMMAAMGLSSFGSSKGKHVDGNQDGATNIKKMRTWRQYMNRRGGFNRPLDKIK